MEKAPSVYNVFEDVEFRHWASSSRIGLVVSMPGIETVETQLREGEHLTRVEGRIAQVLNSDPGNLLSDGIFSGVSDHPVERANLPHLIGNNIYKMRNKLVDRNVITRGKLGVGLGIECHGFYPSEIARVFYILVPFFGEEVPNDHLVEMLYPEDGRTLIAKRNHLAANISLFNSNGYEHSKVRLERTYPDNPNDLDGPGFTRLTWN